MPSSYSPLLRLELIGSGEQSGLWGDTTNKNLGTLLEQAIAGVTTISLSGGAGTVTLQALSGTQDQARSAVLKFIGNPSGEKTIEIPSSEKLYVARNDCGQKITFKTADQISDPTKGGVEVLDGEATLVFCDGSVALAGIQTAAVGTLTVPGGGTGATSFTGGFIKSPGGTGSLTSASAVNLVTEVTGALQVANGGTGTNTFPIGRLLIGNGTSGVSTLAGSVNGQVATWDSANSQWVAQTPTTGITSVSASAPVTGSISGSTLNIGFSPGTQANQVLTWNGTAWTAVLPTAGTITAVQADAPLSASTSSGTATVSLSGIVSVINGGTGASTFTSGSLLTGNGTGTVQTLAAGALGSFVRSNGVAWVASSLTGSDVITALGATPVYTTTNQTISGVKTFSSAPVFSSGFSSTGGTASFTGAASFTGGITSTAYNFHPFDSIFSSVAGGDISIRISNVLRFVFFSNGNFEINGATAVKASGTAWANPSDARIKDSVADYTKGLSVLEQVKVRSWVYNGKGGSKEGEKGIGVVADELMNVLPESVFEMDAKLNPDDVQTTKIKAVDSSEITWLLVKSVQELSERVKSLEAQLAAK